MTYWLTIKLVFRTLRARTGRSILTILGIVIGVAGVIIIISLGAGAQSLVLGQVTKLGSNLISIQPGKSNEKGPPAQVFGVVINTLVNEDADALRNSNRVGHATAINAMVRGSVTVVYENRNIDTNFVGTDEEYPRVFNLNMAAGRFYNQAEDQGGANVVVLGSTVADELFGGTGVDPIGKVVKVKSASAKEAGGVPLRIVGVNVSRGTLFFQDLDDQIYLPLIMGQQQLLGIHYLQMINMKVDSASNIDQTNAAVTSVIK
ncbi:MAG: ABC transporter permease [Patescibacteria group bacterium]